jgi:hypothetical protein
MRPAITLMDGIAERARPLGFFARPRPQCKSIRGSPPSVFDAESVDRK